MNRKKIAYNVRSNQNIIEIEGVGCRKDGSTMTNNRYRITFAHSDRWRKAGE